MLRRLSSKAVVLGVNLACSAYSLYSEGKYYANVYYSGPLCLPLIWYSWGCRKGTIFGIGYLPRELIQEALSHVPSIRQMAQFRLRVIKQAMRTGNISETTRLNRVSRQSIHRWAARYDGTLESLMDRSHRPLLLCVYSNRLNVIQCQVQ